MGRAVAERVVVEDNERIEGCASHPTEQWLRLDRRADDATRSALVRILHLR